MTPKQTERLLTKISNIKRTLAAEKRKFGCYDDSRGLRYLPTKYFIQLQDYKGGLTYLRWFSKNFPDDGGFPDFLFEWTIILFKCGKSKGAVKKAFETFCANTYLFDKFFGRPITPIDKWEGSNLEVPGFTDYLDYSSGQAELADFSEWLDSLTATDDFKSRCDKYIDIHRRLKMENDRETRHYLIMQARQLEETL
ncbi:hypothetical protein FC093_23430 [Ilyomonas limi]|uniref:Uncharacterized protein n=1 Tax=Ilyomonas limi TaxID=2575867 RepID=A0A4U3KRF8_9BACT|nr:hypothetical protein [Ilyomonas limi]TKK64024.1 hypothetical protein FC093_23430 [Ilyomonas limi]